VKRQRHTPEQAVRKLRILRTISAMSSKGRLSLTALSGLADRCSLEIARPVRVLRRKRHRRRTRKNPL